MKSASTIRTKVLLAMLAAVVILAGVSLVQGMVLKSELIAYAEQHAETYRDGEHEVAYTVTVGREFVLFGQAFGKITTFARPMGATGTEILQAVDYQYVKQGGEWVNTDSAMCSHEGCISGAEGAFARVATD